MEKIPEPTKTLPVIRNETESASAGAAQMFNRIAVRSSDFFMAATTLMGAYALMKTGNISIATVFVGSLLLQACLRRFNNIHARHYANPQHRSPPGRNELRCREALARIAAPPLLAITTIGAACFVYEPTDPAPLLIASSQQQPAYPPAAQPD